MMLIAVDAGPSLVVIGLLVVIALIIFAVSAGINNYRNSRLQENALAFGGEVQPASWFRLPSMTFRHGDHIVTFSYSYDRNRKNSYKTHLSIAWPHINLRCEIFPASVFSGLRKLIGMQDIEIGSPRFDEPFIVTGNDEEEIKEFLTPDAQQSLLDLANLNSGIHLASKDLYLQISRGGLTVTKRGYISERHILDPFIGLLLQFFDAAQPSISGIDFLNSSSTKDVTEPHCVVCGEPLRSDLVTCRGCQTTHHLDCWNYFGGCGTYGWGEAVHAPISKGPLVILLAEAGGLIPIIVTVVVVVLIALAFVAAAKAAHKRDTGLAEIARRRGGRMQQGGLIAYPELRIPHGGRTATLKFTAGGENESPRTYLAIPWPQGRLRCEIFMEGPLSPLRKLIGMQDIEIGSPQFDRQFIITGNDETAIKAFLTPDAQARLFDLLRLSSTSSFSAPGLYLQIISGTLTITKATYLSDATSIDRFIELFLQFFDAATSAPLAGIEFLDPTAASHAPSETAPHCIVCGEALLVDLVSCRSCRTPHHRECWQYFGGCTTYACGGKQHVPAKASGQR